MNKKRKQVVLITGVSSGFGNEMMKLFLNNGHEVYGISKRNYEYPKLIHYSADVSDFDACQNAVNNIIEKTGHIDVLINNAGFGISGAVETTSLEQAHGIMNVNFFGAYNMAKAVLPFMREQKEGRIINISSIASAVALPFQAFYSASKSAMDTLFSALREEVFSYNIKITSLMPGDAKTNFTKNRRKVEIDKQNPYYESYLRSITRMENDEQNGFAPIKLARAAYKVALEKNPPFIKTVGFKDGVLYLISKLLPKRIRAWLIRKIYT